jgi:hypothetical protein
MVPFYPKTISAGYFLFDDITPGGSNNKLYPDYNKVFSLAPAFSRGEGGQLLLKVTG